MSLRVCDKLKFKCCIVVHEILKWNFRNFVEGFGIIIVDY